MSFIYTASTISSKKVQNPSFTKRGLDGLTSGRLEHIHQVGLAVEKQVAYDSYISNLPAFLHATQTQTTVAVSHGWYSVKLDADAMLPLNLPPVVVSAKKPFSTEESKQEFIQMLGEDVEAIRSPKEMTYALRKPTLSSLKALPYHLINPNTQSPSDATSIIGMKSYLTTIKIISLFLMTHTYPYKQTPISPINQHGADVAIAWPIGGNEYFNKSTARGLYAIPTNETAVKMMDVSGTVGEFDDDGEPIALSNAVLVAKPAPLRPDVNYGVPNSTPNFPGYVLPYFRGLIEPSNTVIISVVRRFFMGCLADSKEQAGDAWNEWIRGVNKWYQTDAGRIVAHILYNIQTTLEAQAKLFLIIRNGEYLGSCILGYGSGISVDGKFLTPATPDQVRNLAMELDGHSSALKKIVELVNGRRLEDGMMEQEVAELTTTRRVFRFIVDSPRVSDAEMVELRDAVSRLSFHDRLWSVMVNNLTNAIKLLVVEDPIDPDLPMYLEPALIYNDSRAHQVLSIFGPLAPSFVEASGTDFVIPKGIADEDPNSVIDATTGKKPLESIFVSMKKVQAAVLDWQNVVKKRRIRLNVQKRDAGFRTIEYRGEMRDSIWNALKAIPFEEVGQKRKRSTVDEGSGEGSSTKKGKSKETETDFTFDDMF